MTRQQTFLTALSMTDSLEIGLNRMGQLAPCVNFRKIQVRPLLAIIRGSARDAIGQNPIPRSLRVIMRYSVSSCSTYMPSKWSFFSPHNLCHSNWVSLPRRQSISQGYNMPFTDSDAICKVSGHKFITLPIIQNKEENELVYSRFPLNLVDN